MKAQSLTNGTNCFQLDLLFLAGYVISGKRKFPKNKRIIIINLVAVILDTVTPFSSLAKYGKCNYQLAVTNYV